MTGRRLQARRLKLWTLNPYCAICGRLTDLDSKAAMAFHLDHKVPLHKGGEDEDHNCQVLCIPCHDQKTDDDLSRKGRHS
jgi:5-methylcytosine-specific restriction endonuclease McrA